MYWVSESSYLKTNEHILQQQDIAWLVSEKGKDITECMIVFKNIK